MAQCITYYFSLNITPVCLDAQCLKSTNIKLRVANGYMIWYFSDKSVWKIKTNSGVVLKIIVKTKKKTSFETQRDYGEDDNNSNCLYIDKVGRFEDLMCDIAILKLASKNKNT